MKIKTSYFSSFSVAGPACFASAGAFFPARLCAPPRPFFPPLDASRPSRASCAPLPAASWFPLVCAARPPTSSRPAARRLQASLWLSQAAVPQRWGTPASSISVQAGTRPHLHLGLRHLRRSDRRCLWDHRCRSRRLRHPAYWSVWPGGPLWRSCCCFCPCRTDAPIRHRRQTNCPPRQPNHHSRPFSPPPLRGWPRWRGHRHCCRHSAAFPDWQRQL